MTAAIESQHVPSYMRPVPGSVNVPVARFPTPSKLNASIDNPQQVASTFLEAFNDAITKQNYAALASLFIEDGYWRDHLALSWKFRTIQGRASILDFLTQCADSNNGFRLKKVTVDQSSELRSPKATPIDDAGQVLGIQFFITFETTLGTGQGIARLVDVGEGQWKLFTFYIRLEELKGHEEATNQRRSKGVEHGGKPGRKNWAERRAFSAEFQDGDEPAVLILGAGQAGLTVAARLKMLGVRALMIDQNERIGDNWRKRYHQLVLHDPVYYDHMPYLPFPAQWPVFTPKDKLGQFFEAYATLLELDAWTSATIESAKWNQDSKSWTVTVTRKKGDSTETRTFHPRHIIQATGHSGKKNVPDIKGMSNFEGTRLCHSSEFTGALDGQDGKGKRAVVIGSCNSAHDIAQDFLEKGYHITIVQRSSTHVVSSKAVTEIALGSLYYEGGPPVEDSDLILYSYPTSVLKAMQIKVTERCAEMDKELLDGLKAAGFKTDMGPNAAGLLFKYFQRGGGYYIDVGASKLIADGKIHIKQGQEIDEILPHGIRFADNTEIEADEIIYATGYQNMRTQTQTIFGGELASKLNDVWGYNDEGEMRTMWQDSGHPGFYYHGGNLAICRFYSKLLALQIKGLEEGLYGYGDL